MECDICGRQGDFKHLKADIVRGAVRKGFNPYDLGLIRTFGSSEAGFAAFKNIAETSNTDWNVCPGCEEKLQPYLSGSNKDRPVLPPPAAAKKVPSHEGVIARPEQVAPGSLVCSFCGEGVKREQIHLEANNKRLCRECLALCLKLIGGSFPKGPGGRRTGEKQPPNPKCVCSFCGQNSYRMAVAGSGANVCDECVDR